MIFQEGIAASPVSSPDFTFPNSKLALLGCLSAQAQ